MLLLRSYADYRHIFVDDGFSNVLSPSEQALYHAFKVPKRRREWLLGRVTTKDAAQRLMRSEHGLDVSFNDIEVLPDEDQVPTINIVGVSADKAPRLMASLSHRGEFAVSVVEPFVEGRGIGVDIDKVEPRSDAFLRDYFSQREQQAVLCERPLEQDRQVTAFWCVKEAVLKALKKGLSVPAGTVEVLEIAADGKVRAQCDQALSTRNITACCWHLPNYVVTWAVLDDSTTQDLPRLPYPARLWLPETATPDAQLPAPLLKVVGS